MTISAGTTPGFTVPMTEGAPSWTSSHVTVFMRSHHLMTVDQWAEIRRLHYEEGQSTKAVAKSLGLRQRAVRKVIFPGN